MTPTTNLAAALSGAPAQAPWTGQRSVVPVDAAFIAAIAGGAPVRYATAPSDEAGYEVGKYTLVDGRPNWVRYSLAGDLIGRQELANGELPAKVLRLSNPKILDQVTPSTLQRAKLAAQLVVKMRELRATPTRALHDSVGSGAVARGSKLASEMTTLIGELHSPARVLASGHIVSAYNINGIDAMPSADAMGAGKNNRLWRAPVTLPDGRTVFTNGDIMLFGKVAPYASMTVGTLVQKGLSKQGTSDQVGSILRRAKKAATNTVQGVYAVRSNAGGAFVGMVSGDEVVTIKRDCMAMAQNWCGTGYRMRMDDANGMVYFSSVDGKKEAVIAPTRMEYTADELRFGVERVKPSLSSLVNSRVAQPMGAPSAIENIATPLLSRKTEPATAAVVLDTIATRPVLVEQPSRDLDANSHLLQGMASIMARMASVAEAQARTVAQLANQNARPMEVMVRIEQSPAVINFTAPQQPAPVVQITNEVPPAQVVMVGPTRSVSEVERDPGTQEILRTVTTHKFDAPGLS